jgi:hypothetical protein
MVPWGQTLPGCLVLRFVPGGLCAALREYWNANLGRRLAAPAGWGCEAVAESWGGVRAAAESWGCEAAAKS